MLTVRGLEFEFDIFDEDCAIAYEEAVGVMQKASEQKGTSLGLVESLRQQCRAVFVFFDTLFGEGTHEELFGERVNLNDCLDAYTDLIDQVSAQKTALDARLHVLRGAPSTPNRSTRRSIKS